MIAALKKRFHYYRFFWSTKKLRKNFPFYDVMGIEETARLIKKDKKSISRFGDGEFRLLLDDSAIGFQQENPLLTQKLRETIQSALPNHFVALPETYRLHNGLNWRVKYWWLNFINNIGVKTANFLHPEKRYANAFLTRFYLDYENKKHILKTVSEIKNIWLNEDILIVEGKYSRLGVGNDLFDDAKSVKRILCPEKDAFSKYEEILEQVKKLGTEKLILLALGPTATVMAYDLAKETFWALDIGHIDLEYMWFLSGVTEKSPVEGRLVNESEKQLSLEVPEKYRKKYEESIILAIE